MTKLMRPFNTFPTLLPDDMFESFEQFFKGLDSYNPTTNTLSLRKFPKGDVFFNEKGDRVIELALAGYSKEQLSVTIEDGKLIIAAEKCEGDKDCGERTLARRAFRQVFSNFGQGFDLGNADVVYKDGLLRVVVPRIEKEDTAKTLLIK